MNWYRFTPIALLMLFGSLVLLSGCEEEDEENDVRACLIGEWQTEDTFQGVTETETIIFRSNGTYSYESNTTPAIQGCPNPDYRDEGTFIVNGSLVTLITVRISECGGAFVTIPPEESSANLTCNGDELSVEVEEGGAPQIFIRQ